MLPGDEASFEQELALGSDRSVAILLTAQLQRTLEQLITMEFRNGDRKTVASIFTHGGPLENLHGQTLIAYALGLIDEDTRNRLNLFRRVRNIFDLTVGPVSFADKEVGVECASLPVDELTEVNFSSEELALPRVRFIGAAVNAIMAIDEATGRAISRRVATRNDLR